MGQSFADQYDPDKRVANIDEVTGQPTGTFTDSNDLSLTQKDGYTQMVDAYNQEQQSKTKNSFLSSLANFGAADAAMPDNFSGLQNTMGGITLNPDGTLNYNNTQPQNLGFTSMVDMANNANNFDSQFNNTPMQMSPTGPFNFQTRSAPAALNMDRFAGVSDLGRNDMDVEQVEPQYRIRDQLKRDFLEGGLFKDAKQSLGQTKNTFLEDVSGLRNIIGSGFDKFSQGIGSLKDRGLDLGRMAISGIGNLLGAGPLGAIISRLPQEPLFRETLANSRKANPLGTRGVGPNGVQLDGVSDFGGFTTDDLGRITNNGLNYNTPEGIMSGYNAGFDLASAALGRIGNIQDLMEDDLEKQKLDPTHKLSKFHKERQLKIDNLKTAAVASAQAKRQAYQDKIDRARDSAAREKARAKSITAGYGGGNDNNRPSTGPTSVGANMGVGGGHAADYGFLKDGGSVGLASMFTRRG